MDIQKYLEKAIHLSPPFGHKSTDVGAGLVVRWGYPEPETGMTLIEGHRGDIDNGIDWALDNLRNYVEQLIEHVINDCIGTVQQNQAISDECKEAVARTIREHFEITIQ